MSLDVNQVKQFAVYVDQKRNGGNQNGYVDGSEVSIFKKKIKTADRTVDVDSILKDYDKNKVTREASYDGTTAETVEEPTYELPNLDNILFVLSVGDNVTSESLVIATGIPNSLNLSNIYCDINKL